MALQSSGPISNGNVQGEFGGSNPASLSEYYSAATGVPSSGNPISLSDFYGKSNTITFSYTIQAAGGAGGYGRSDGGGSGVAASGATTSISGSGISTVSVAGGAGGANGASLWYDASNRDGQASFYGAGGAGGSGDVHGDAEAALQHEDQQREAAKDDAALDHKVAAHEEATHVLRRAVRFIRLHERQQPRLHLRRPHRAGRAPRLQPQHELLCPRPGEQLQHEDHHEGEQIEHRQHCV